MSHGIRTKVHVRSAYSLVGFSQLLQAFSSVLRTSQVGRLESERGVISETLRQHEAGVVGTFS